MRSLQFETRSYCASSPSTRLACSPDVHRADSGGSGARAQVLGPSAPLTGASALVGGEAVRCVALPYLPDQ